MHDYNEDGRKDLVVGQEGIGSPCNVYVYLNQGTNAEPVFNDSTSILFNGSPLTYWRTIPVLLDLDGDNLKDMVLGGWYSDVRFYSNQGTNANPIFTTYLYLVDPDSSTFLNGNPPRINFTDWDGDGDQDMITCDYYGSVFLRENITQPGIHETTGSTARGTLFTVFPNPVVNRATFTIQALSDAPVTLDIYGVDGRLVSTPYSGTLPEGITSLVWDTRTLDRCELPNGAYIAVVRHDSDVQTLKLLIMR